MRDFIWNPIGDGSNVSIWSDRWCNNSHLSRIISTRDIYRVGYDLSTKVKDSISNGTWNWPHDWFIKYPILNLIVVPNIMHNTLDIMEWRTHDGSVKSFSVATVWQCIRLRDEEVKWCDVVWFAKCIPWLAFHLWLVVKRCLKTQYMLRYWDVHDNLPVLFCPLCESQPDSHEHLFFECIFSRQVWDCLKVFAGLPYATASISAIVDLLVPISKRRYTRSVIAKLVVVPLTYFIWQERNWRLFKKQKRTYKQVIDCIKSAVWLKLLSCCFKKSKDGMTFIYLWKLPEARPTSLEEAFSLARITEARLEDERSTAAIAKTNDLNTELSVHDLEETNRHTSNKVEVVKTSMVATSNGLEQQEYQDDLNEFFKEKDDAKPPTFADVFGSNGGNDSETTSPKAPVEEVVNNGIEELDNESEDRKVDMDVKREGEPTVLARFGSDRDVVIGFGFHDRMIGWIMECVSSTSFSLSINGVLHGYFKGRRGLRQGDPLSPYLFTLIMEVLTLILQRRVRDSEFFTYHRYCSKLELVNLCFADDIFLFAHGDAHSTTVIIGALNEFKLASGLVPSLPNSTTYFCNVLNHTKLAILNILPFEEGRLSVVENSIDAKRERGGRNTFHNPTNHAIMETETNNNIFQKTPINHIISFLDVHFKSTSWGDHGLNDSYA
nr:hypothetical protein [Tanacetum cinerariifolium]